MTNVPPSDEQDPHLATGMQGCGLAAYAALLMVICLTGIIGMVLSTGAILTQQPESVSKLVHGSQVATWRLQPMRDANLLHLTQVPNAWHDESPMRDGTRSCALIDEGIVILNEVAITIPYSDVTALRVDPSDDGRHTVVIEGPAGTGGCSFGPGEGGERFVRQINAERKTPEVGTPASAPDPSTE